MLHFLSRRERRFTILAAGVVALLWLAVYTSTMSPTVNFIDSGELITALNEPGVAHPPGYPLYTLTGYLFTRLPLGETAWRVNFASALWGAVCVGLFFLLVMACTRYVQWKQQVKESRARPARPARKRGHKARDPEAVSTQISVEWRPNAQYWLAVSCGVLGATLLAISSTFWSRTAQAKLYSLHYAFVALLLLAALDARWAWERDDLSAMRRWLLGLALGVGFSLTNHLMTVLLIPGLTILLVAGSAMTRRFRSVLSTWKYTVPALLAPLLLYLYLPLRSMQGPLMNWGTPNTLGDFWRHITGWQYSAYLSPNPLANIPRLTEFAGDQWAVLSWFFLAIGIGAGLLLTTRSPALGAATFLTAVLTFAFSMLYGISEIEPYLVPLYMMVAFWLGTLPVTIWLVLEDRATDAPELAKVARWASYGTIAVLGAVALLTLAVQYSRQDHSRDRLAEQFVQNVFSELPPNSILLTDYWDFYAPTIYMQNVRGERPDVAIIDTTSVKYPWYVGYLEKYRPELVARSRDILGTFQPEQRRWVNGEPFNGVVLDESYYTLLELFVSHHIAERPVFMLWQQCPEGACERDKLIDRLSAKFAARPAGLTTQVLAAQPGGEQLPEEPNYSLAGLLDRSVPLDMFSRLNSQFYLGAYSALSELYRAAGRTDAADRMTRRYLELQSALEGR